MTNSTAYAAAKRAKADVRVFFGGTAGVPFDFIGKVYVLGERPIFFTGGAFEGFAETASADYVEVALLDVVQH